MFDVAIVGAGLAGLCCAVGLEHAGLSVKVLEAADAPGGRIRTDQVDGFRLDRGFQILLSGYPELARQIDIKALRLRPFAKGALVRHNGRFHHFADPFRSSLGTATSIALDPVVSIGDKLRIARLRHLVKQGEPADLFRRPEVTTRRFLEEYGFSPKMLDRFFVPFLTGVFLERELATSSRYFQFLFRMFAFGDAAVPENGMEMVPRQLAVRLKKGTLETNVGVSSVLRNGNGFVLDAGKRANYLARNVVLAVEDAQVRALLANRDGQGLTKDMVQWNRTTTFYYASDRTPIDGPLLALNGDGPTAGPLNSVAVLSQASERYAPPGMHLIAANVVGRAPQSNPQIEQLEREVRDQLQRWFGAQVGRWDVVGGYPIEHASPLCSHAQWQQSTTRLMEGVYACGDYRETPSIQGALASGRKAAECVLHHTS
ncbi:MAG TPA: NAD(P)/FAD-dependent oxidoreductase [Terracidiphilus sp.]|jgi:phytoene dehydrogenase-like protein